MTTQSWQADTKSFREDLNQTVIEFGKAVRYHVAHDDPEGVLRVMEGLKRVVGNAVDQAVHEIGNKTGY